MAAVDALAAEPERPAAGATGALRLGVSPFVARRVLPALLPTLAAEWPAARFEVVERASDGDLVEAVRFGGLDAGFGELALEAGPFEIRVVIADPCVLLVPSDSPLARADSAAGLKGSELSLVGRPGHRLARLVDRHLRAAGFFPRYPSQADSDAAAQAVVAAGTLAAVLPRLAVDENDPRTSVVELGGILPRRTIDLFWRREGARNPALRTFVSAVVDSCRRSTVGGVPTYAV